VTPPRQPLPPGTLDQISSQIAHTVAPYFDSSGRSIASASSSTQLAPATLQISSVYRSSYPAPNLSTYTAIQSDSVTATRVKRPYDFTSGPNTMTSDLTESLTKRTRHCSKCGSSVCKGKGGRAMCMNSCQDCGKLDCRGRNSRKPDVSCSQAWTST
jgi:hypothetical protein